jgi:hypothetical protein
MEAHILEVILWFVGSFLVAIHLGREPEIDSDEIFNHYYKKGESDDVDGCK